MFAPFLNTFLNIFDRGFQPVFQMPRFHLKPTVVGLTLEQRSRTKKNYPSLIVERLFSFNVESRVSKE